ncbi:carbohydrate-binding protein [Tessaracoccus aquimaris]|uniref:Carbohydrate-binding protein n=1 Tax=Tessaracoccus aquimaris TaxID=1332264 RepID=A0A1Q2CNK9_9ACTN|nr:DUF4185 domain-containing protein [Tessaracoccus aquimaris]AQP47696.1 carbohydrate-binding protein [Tessaracoccus aquimaris]
MDLTRRGLLAAGTVASLATACSGGRGGAAASPVPGGFVLGSVDGVTRVAQLTGPGAINDTASVLLAGADLGHMTTVGERTWFVFGDNFGIRDADAFGGTGEVWKSNCLAWTTDDDPTDGITFDGWVLDDLEQVKEVLPGDHKPNDQVGEVTKIPTQLFAVDETMYLAYMSVTHWGEPGVWETDHAGLARSTDDGQTWEILEAVTWPGESGFVQLAQVPLTVDGVDWIYLWGIPAGRFGEVSLMRVRAQPAAVEELSSYEYFAGEVDGEATWSTDLNDAVVVLDRGTAELSVLWSSHLERWLLASMLDNGSAVLYEGLSPWGPWSEPHEILTQADTPGLYAPYLCPRYVADDGRRLFFTLSIWGPYQVYWYSMDLRRTGGD